MMSNVTAKEIPRYKPSSASSTAIDITTNAYGHSLLAPGALGLGEVAPNFRLPLSHGGSVELAELVSQGPVAIIFYRGHW